MINGDHNYTADTIMQNYTTTTNFDLNFNRDVDYRSLCLDVDYRSLCPGVDYRSLCLGVDYQVEDSQVIVNRVHFCGRDITDALSTVNRLQIATQIEDTLVYGY
jgi:hypothetical protein